VWRYPESLGKLGKALTSPDMVLSYNSEGEETFFKKYNGTLVKM
jgi:hypothetical protein